MNHNLTSSTKIQLPNQLDWYSFWQGFGWGIGAVVGICIAWSVLV